MAEVGGYDNPIDKPKGEPKTELTHDTFSGLLTHTQRLTNIARSPIDSPDVDVPGIFSIAQSEGRLNDSKVILGRQALAYPNSDTPWLPSQELGGFRRLFMSSFNESFGITNPHDDGSHTLATIDYRMQPSDPSMVDATLSIDYIFTTKGDVLYEIYYHPMEETNPIKPEIVDELDALGFSVDDEATIEGTSDLYESVTIKEGKLEEKQGQALLRVMKDLREENLAGW